MLHKSQNFKYLIEIMCNYLLKNKQKTAVQRSTVNFKKNVTHCCLVIMVQRDLSQHIFSAKMKRLLFQTPCCRYGQLWNFVNWFFLVKCVSNLYLNKTSAFFPDASAFDDKIRSSFRLNLADWINITQSGGKIHEIRLIASMSISKHLRK